MIKKNIFILLIIFGGSISPIQASQYEVEGSLLWDEKPLKNVKVYLLRNQSEDLNILDDDGKKKIEVFDRKFEKEYKSLEEESKQMIQQAMLSSDLLTRKMFKKKFIKLIKDHCIRKISHKNGKFYLNVSPGTQYYLVAVKKQNFWVRKKPFLYWIKSVYFESGETNFIKKIIFDEDSVNKL